MSDISSYVWVIEVLKPNLYIILSIYIYIYIYILAHSPDDPQGIRVASVIEFSVLCSLSVFCHDTNFYCVACGGLILYCSKIGKFDENIQRIQLQRPLLFPVDHRGERANFNITLWWQWYRDLFIGYILKPTQWNN